MQVVAAMTSLALTARRLLRACDACRGEGSRVRRKHRRRCETCDGTGLVAGEAARRCEDEVGICGGGIAGLALALALQHRGIACRVYERDEHVGARAEGYGLTMQQGGKALRALGILDLVRDAGVWTGAHLCLDADGQVLGVHGARGRGDKETYAIHVPRQAVRALLLSQLEPGTVQWCEQVLAVSATHVVTSRGSRRHSIIAGCDGIRSVARRSLLRQDYALREAGVCVMLGRAMLPENSLDRFGGPGAVFEVVDGRSRIYAMPYDSRGQTMWQLSTPDGPPSLDRALDIVTQWHEFPELEALVKRTKPDDVTAYPIFDRHDADLQSLGDRLPPTCALLGDAAHPMCPFKAQGANQALLDALSLARHLAASLDRPDLAVQRYNADMVPRTLTKMQASRRASELLHSPAARARSPSNSAVGLTRTAAAAAAAEQSDDVVWSSGSSSTGGIE